MLNITVGFTPIPLPTLYATVRYTFNSAIRIATITIIATYAQQNFLFKNLENFIYPAIRVIAGVHML